ncbi:unnamed protein product, partial [Dicrocoelium dendriticum]
EEEEVQAAADELAEKAFNRLQEVEALINEGRHCDIFIKPLVEILEYFEEPRRARSLLLQYARRLPENPNAFRYLADWYRRRAKAFQITSNPSTADPNTPHLNPADKQLPVNERSLRDEPPCSSSPSRTIEKMLRYKIEFSRRVLPEPAPVTYERCSSVAEERKLLRFNRPHILTITLCLKHGKRLRNKKS